MALSYESEYIFTILKILFRIIIESKAMCK